MVDFAKVPESQICRVSRVAAVRLTRRISDEFRTGLVHLSSGRVRGIFSRITVAGGVRA